MTSHGQHHVFCMQLKEGDASADRKMAAEEKNDPDYVPGAEPADVTEEVEPET